jgi:hypothetical protein
LFAIDSRIGFQRYREQQRQLAFERAEGERAKEQFYWHYRLPAPSSMSPTKS